MGCLEKHGDLLGEHGFKGRQVDSSDCWILQNEDVKGESKEEDWKDSGIGEVSN